jgi:TonB family protein
MNAPETLIARFLVNSLWQVGVLFLVAVPVSYLLKRCRPSIQEIFWTVVLLLSTGLPLLSLSISAGWVRQPPIFSTLVVPSAERLSSVAFGEGVPTPAETPGIGAGLAMAYLVLLGLALAAFLHSVWAMSALRRSSAGPLRRGNTCELLRNCSREFSLSPPQLFLSNRIRTPVTMGHRRPLVLLPGNLAGGDSASVLTAVLSHELAHIARGDFLRNLVLELVTIPLQFHPAVWYLRKQVRRYRELAADELVTERIMSRSNYARSLLSAAETGLGRIEMRGNLAVGCHNLEERIRCLIKPRRKASRRFQALLLVTGCLLVAAPAAAATVLQGSQASSPAAEEPHQPGQPGLTHPVLVEQTIPGYTQEAKDAGINGDMILTCVIGTDGRARECQVDQDIGYGLADSAIQEIEQNWRFEPGTLDGKPVDVQATIEVQFRLKGTLNPEEAEGSRVVAVRVEGPTEAVASARKLIRTQEGSPFHASIFAADQERLKDSNLYSVVVAQILEGEAGGVTLLFRVEPK